MKRTISLLILFFSISLISLPVIHAMNNDSNLLANDVSQNWVSPPRTLYKIIPVYPPEAEKYRVEGTVLIKIKFFKNGSIWKEFITASSGYELLDNAALEAVKGWQLIPAKDKDGQNVDCSMLVPISFKLSNDHAYITTKSVIDSWDPFRIDTFIHPGVYNSYIDQVYTQIKQFDFNNTKISLEKLVSVIETIDVSKRYDEKIYNAIARRLIKKVYPGNDSSKQWVQKAMDYEMKGDYKKTLTCYDKAISLEPYDVDYYADRAFIYELLNDNRRATNDFNKAIELEPNNDRHYNMRGFNYYALGDYEDAITDYNKAIELKPEADNYYYGRGLAYYNLKEYQRAIDDYNKAVILKDDIYKYYSMRAQAYNGIGKYQEALADCNKSLEIASHAPDLYSVYYERGQAYLALHEYKNALSDFDKAIKLSSINSDYYDGRGQVYCALGEYQRAIEDYNIAIAFVFNKPKYNVKKVGYYLNRAAAYQAVGRYKEAADDKLKALNLEQHKRKMTKIKAGI